VTDGLYVDPTGRFGVRTEQSFETPIPMRERDATPEVKLQLKEVSTVETPPRSRGRRLATHWFWFDNGELRVVYPSLPWGDSVAVRIAGLGTSTVRVDYTPAFRRMAQFGSMLSALFVRGLLSVGVVPIVGTRRPTVPGRSVLSVTLRNDSSPHPVVVLADGTETTDDPVVAAYDSTGSVLSGTLSAVEVYDPHDRSADADRTVTIDGVTGTLETVTDAVVDPEQYYLSLYAFASDDPEIHASAVKSFRGNVLQERLESVERIERRTIPAGDVLNNG
jgi:hypothetical protein